MDETDALAWLTLRTDATAEPVLDSGALQLLLELATTVDADGYEPTDDEWTATYSVQGLYRAAAEAWTIKAGKCAGKFDFTTDGQTFRRSQMVDHCEAQAAMWRRKLGRSVRTPPPGES